MICLHQMSFSVPHLTRKLNADDNSYKTYKMKIKTCFLNSFIHLPVVVVAQAVNFLVVSKMKGVSILVDTEVI